MAIKIKPINLKWLCSKFEDDISKNELSVTVCLGIVTCFPHWVPAKTHWCSQWLDLSYKHTHARTHTHSNHTLTSIPTHPHKYLCIIYPVGSIICRTGKQEIKWYLFYRPNLKKKMAPSEKKEVKNKILKPCQQNESLLTKNA